MEKHHWTQRAFFYELLGELTADLEKRRESLLDSARCIEECATEYPDESLHYHDRAGEYHAKAAACSELCEALVKAFG